MRALTFKRLSKAVIERQRERFSQCFTWSGPEWGNALAGETGELCNLLKKQHRAMEGEAIAKESIAKEIADVVIYAMLTANNQGIDLEKAVIQKFNEVSKRVKSKLKL